MGDRRYVVTKSHFNSGKSTKLVAEELGGPDYISLNWYDTTRGGALRPCEMPAAKVIAFVCDLCPDQLGNSRSSARPASHVPCRLPSAIST
ncbi:MAG: hypothetical protein AAFY39_10020 [Pseudomonadota bacterium]